MEQQMPWIWLCVIILSCFVEFLTSVQLTAIWMSVGGIAAIIADFCGAPIYLQIIIFIVVTAVSLILTRPLAKKLMKFEKTATNADMFIGKTGTVLTPINGRKEVGRVKVMGDTWSAVADNDEVIPENAEVYVKSIEGVKLIVEPKNK